MIINHNLPSMNTDRQLGINNFNTAKSLEKLSSGLRINRAGDDAAGLAISEKMRAQVRGLDQASRNGQDGISLIQTAEGGLAETHSILQRMRELAVQSSTDTNTSDDRSKIQSEVDQLAKEITRISNTTEFNTQNLLAGGLNDTFHIGANAGQNVAMSINAMDANSLGVAGSLMTAGTLAGAGLSTVSEAGRGMTAAVSDKIVVVKTAATTGAISKNIQVDTANTTTMVVTGAAGNTGTSDATYNVKIASVSTGGATGNTVSSIQYSKDNGTSWTTVTADFSTAQTIDGMNFQIGASAVGTHTVGDTFSISATAAKATLQLQSSGSVNIGAVQTVHYGDTSVTIGDPSNGKTIKASFTFSSLSSATATFDVTAATSSVATVVAGKVNTQAIAAAGINVSDQTNANTAITTIDTAIKTVSTERSKLGAYQNRLEHTIANLGTSSENMTAAESRVRDVDMAKEMMQFQKNNILSQAATAMLAQANQQPQGVLQLLR